MAANFLQRIGFGLRLDPILEVRKRPRMQRLAELHQFAGVPGTGRGIQQLRIDRKASQGSGDTAVEKTINVIHSAEMRLERTALARIAAHQRDPVLECLGVFEGMNGRRVTRYIEQYSRRIGTAYDHDVDRAVAMHPQFGNRHASGNRCGDKIVEAQFFPAPIARQAERLQDHGLVLGLESLFVGL